MLNRLDIHGYRVQEAKILLDQFIDKVPHSLHEVVIVHGYRGGTSLRTFVRKNYHHPRVTGTMVSLNPGETILKLK